MDSSRDMYRMLAHEAGWTPDRYETWLSATLREAWSTSAHGGAGAPRSSKQIETATVGAVDDQPTTGIALLTSAAQVGSHHETNTPLIECLRRRALAPSFHSR